MPAFVFLLHSLIVFIVIFVMWRGNEVYGGTNIWGRYSIRFPFIVNWFTFYRIEVVETK